MKYILRPLKILFFIIFVINCTLVFAINSKVIEKQADTSIKELYHILSTMPITSMSDRINWISNHFKGKTYILGSLGEGPNAHFDQFPQYRVDGFDCDTFVTTVISLALADSLQSFQQCFKFIRYKDGKMSYINRNHFTSIDWNVNNQLHGLLKDITLSITDNHKHSVAVYANAVIDKPSWYAHKNIDTIRLQKGDVQEQEKRLTELKAKGAQLEITPSKLAYIPLTTLFPKNNEPDLYIFSQIPHGAIIEIVRPNWDLKKQIGTALNISHLGFALRINKQLYFRQASSIDGTVNDVLLTDYLKKQMASPTIKGINVQIVVPSLGKVPC